MGGISITMPVESTEGIKDENDILIPPEVVADYIHSVLDSDRKVYSEYIVNRLQEKNIVFASENWWEENTLLLPAQVSAQCIRSDSQQESGPGFQAHQPLADQQAQRPRQ